MQSDLGFEITREVLATADVFLRESQRLFRPHKMTAAQYNVLTILAGAPDGLSQREIGDVLVVDRSNVTGLIDRLEKAGWVKRMDDPADRRVYRVMLTTAGRKRFDAVQPLYHSVVSQVTQELNPKQVRDALKVLQQLQAGAMAWRLPE